MTDESDTGKMIGASLANQVWLNVSMMALLEASDLADNEKRAHQQSLRSTVVKLVDALEASDPGTRERITTLIPELFDSNVDDNGPNA